MKLFCFSLFQILLITTYCDANPSVNFLLQAEDLRANDDVIRYEDDDALGGEYVSRHEPYEPLIVIPAKSVEVDPVVVWVRTRGMGLQLKLIQKDGQVEQEWKWDAPAQWKWVRMGSFSVTELGQGFLIISAPDKAERAGIDAVLLSGDTTFDPNKDSDQSAK